MSENNHGILQQVRRNAVALISLFVALSSLGYNTWRNELTEHNRNQRQSAFEILLKLGELQQVVFHSHYDRDLAGKGNPRTGWAYVLLVKDLANVLQPPMAAMTTELQATWSAHWSDLGGEQESADAILDAIDNVRTETLRQLNRLE